MVLIAKEQYSVFWSTLLLDTSEIFSKSCIDITVLQLTKIFFGKPSFDIPKRKPTMLVLAMYLKYFRDERLFSQFYK